LQRTIQRCHPLRIPPQALVACANLLEKVGISGIETCCLLRRWKTRCAKSWKAAQKALVELQISCSGPTELCRRFPIRKPSL